MAVGAFAVLVVLCENLSYRLPDLAVGIDGIAVGDGEEYLSVLIGSIASRDL